MSRNSRWAGIYVLYRYEPLSEVEQRVILYASYALSTMLDKSSSGGWTILIRAAVRPIFYFLSPLSWTPGVNRMSWTDLFLGNLLAWTFWTVWSSSSIYIYIYTRLACLISDHVFILTDIPVELLLLIQSQDKLRDLEVHLRLDGKTTECVYGPWLEM